MLQNLCYIYNLYLIISFNQSYLAYLQQTSSNLAPFIKRASLKHSYRVFKIRENFNICHRYLFEYFKSVQTCPIEMIVKWGTIEY